MQILTTWCWGLLGSSLRFSYWTLKEHFFQMIVETLRQLSAVLLTSINCLQKVNAKRLWSLLGSSLQISSLEHHSTRALGPPVQFPAVFVTRVFMKIFTKWQWSLLGSSLLMFLLNQYLKINVTWLWSLLVSSLQIFLFSAK